ncbi:Reticuline oxidase [Leucoagaricus sp. SymC.cos]|nr:Reticuline oxidase [Leucoagaricus sp. SymC.cos]
MRMIMRRFSLLATYYFLLGSLFTLSLALSLVDELRNDGIELVAPGDSSFGSASAAFNHRFTFHPTAVTFPQTPEQVSTIVQTAVKYNTHVSARSGGHSYIANGLGGRNGTLVIDLNRHLTGIQVDNAAGTATIQSGNRLGDIALALNEQGRGIGHGTCPYVGIGGHASFAGFGYASRLWGMAIDAIVEINLVLANGTTVTASKSRNSELFWGMRGAGPSFGITTSITVQTFPVPPSATVFTYNWDMAADKASSAVQAYQSFSLGQVPPEFGSEFMLYKGSKKGRVGMTLQGVWFGDADLFEDTINPLLNQIDQQPQETHVQPGSYINSVAFFGDEDGRLNTTGIPDGNDNFYVKSLLTPESQPIATESWDAFANYLANQGFSTSLDWFIEIEEFGGPKSAVNAVPVDDTSFVTRDALFLIQFYGYTDDVNANFPGSGFTLVDGMVNSIITNMPSTWPYNAYTNYLDNRLQDWQRLYFGQHYGRLQQLKASVDPKNMFQFPTSIELP